MRTEISVELIKQLRERTGAGVLDCKKALEETSGDLERAEEILRAKGAAVAERRAMKEAREGLIEAYIHSNGRYGSLVEVNCETDFVARTDEFRKLAREVAIQVVAMSPKYVSREDVPDEERARQEELFLKEVERVVQGKASEVIEGIMQGRMERWYSEVCLLEQPYFRDESRTIKELVEEAMAKLGEKIVVRRFVRFELGERR